MIFSCIFVPFLHDETPKPIKVEKNSSTKDSDQALMDKIK